MSLVLIADDDPDIRELVAFKLGQAGHRVVAVADGEAALAEARAETPDLVLLDVMMPRRTGMEVCRELRADPRTGSVPVILLTAKAQEADIEQGFAAGADDYIVKPFSPRELVSRVTTALNRVTP
ncbi:MAG: response regulator transcription factor [Acidimicrobiia bacterium]